MKLQDYLYFTNGGLAIFVKQTECDPLRISVVCDKHAKSIQHMGVSWGELIFGIRDNLRAYGPTESVSVVSRGLPGDASWVKIPDEVTMLSCMFPSKEKSMYKENHPCITLTLTSNLTVVQGDRTMSSAPTMKVIIEDTRAPVHADDKPGHESAVITDRLIHDIVQPLLDQHTEKGSLSLAKRVQQELRHHLPVGVLIEVQGYVETDPTKVETNLNGACGNSCGSGACGKGSASKPTVSPEQFSSGFGYALTMLEEGYCVTRAGWNGKHMYLQLHKSKNPVVLDHIELVYPEGSAAYPDGARVSWAPSQTDMLSKDWAVITSPVRAE